MVYTPQFGKSTTLAAPMSDSETSSGTLASATFTNFTDDFLVIDYNIPAKREVIKCSVTGTGISSITRAQEGTTAVEHSIGAKVAYNFVPSHYKKLADFTGARATLASTLSTTVSGTATKVALDTETYDVGGNFANGSFTAPVAGYYYVSGTVYFNSITAVGKHFQAIVRVDGAAVKISTLYSATGFVDLSLTATDIVHVDAGKKVELYYAHNDATTVDLQGGVAGTSLTVTLFKED